MPQQIEVPGMGVVEFPDGMTDDQIVAAIKANRPSPQQAARQAARQARERRLAGDTSALAGLGPADVPALENVAAGAGKFLHDLGRGVSQLTGNMSREEFDEIKRRDDPLLDTKSGLAGNILGGAAFSAPLAFIPGVNTVAGGALAGAGLGATQPVGVNDSRIFNTALGGGFGAVGAKIGEALQRRAKAAADNLRKRESVARGRELGFRTTPGQATGSKPLQLLESKLESQSATSAPFFNIKEANERALGRQAAAAIGEVSDRVDANVLDDAFNRLGRVFESVKDDIQRNIDPGDFLRRMARIEDSVDGIVDGFADNKLVRRLINLAADGKATGAQLQPLSSKLGRAIEKQMKTATGDRDLGLALAEVKDIVDDLLQSGLPAAQRATFQEARKQYRNLINMTSRTGVVDSVTGRVSGPRLANVLEKADKRGFLRGQNRSDFFDAVRFSREFAPIVGNSGTASRSQGMIEAAIGLPFGIASKLYASDPFVRLLLRSQAGLDLLARRSPQSIGRLLPPVAAGGGLLGTQASTQ